MASRHNDAVSLQVGLRQLGELSEPEFQQLVAALGGTEPAVYIYQIMDRVIRVAPQLSRRCVRAVLEAVDVLIRDSREEPVETPDLLLERVGPQLERLPEIGDSKTIRTVILPRIEVLMTIEAVELTSKARQVFLSQPRVFKGVRIVSDVRPVFNDDQPLALRAAVVAHTLSIRFEEEDEEQTFSVALDSVDLVDLKEAVERAESKEALIREQLVARNARLLGVEPADD